MQLGDGRESRRLDGVGDRHRPPDLAVPPGQHRRPASLLPRRALIGEDPRNADPAFSEQLLAADDDLMAIHDAACSQAGQGHEAVGRRQRPGLRAGSRADGRGHRMLRGLLHGSRITQQNVAANPGHRLNSRDRHQAGRDRAGLIQHHGVDPPGGLKRLVALDEDAQLGSAPAGHHQRGRSSQPERTRTGNDQDRKTSAERMLRRAPGQQPCGKREHCQDQHDRHEHGRDPVCQPLDGSLLRLRLLHQPDQVRELCVLAHLDGPDDQAAGQRDGPADDTAALGHLRWHGLAGHHAAVHRRLPELDVPVCRDRLPRPDHEQVTGPQQGDGDAALASVISEDAYILRAGVSQRAHRLARRTASPGLEEPAGQQERGHRRGDLQVDTAAG